MRFASRAAASARNGRRTRRRNTYRPPLLIRISLSRHHRCGGAFTAERGRREVAGEDRPSQPHRANCNSVETIGASGSSGEECATRLLGPRLVVRLGRLFIAYVPAVVWPPPQDDNISATLGDIGYIFSPASPSYVYIPSCSPPSLPVFSPTRTLSLLSLRRISSHLPGSYTAGAKLSFDALRIRFPVEFCGDKGSEESSPPVSYTLRGPTIL